MLETGGSYFHLSCISFIKCSREDGYTSTFHEANFALGKENMKTSLHFSSFNELNHGIPFHSLFMTASHCYVSYIIQMSDISFR